MLSDKERYKHLVENHKFFFSQFILWMVFFISINGGLLLAYTGEGLKDSFEKIIILFVGYFASILFHCSCKSICCYTYHFMDLIWIHEKKIQNVADRIYSRAVVTSDYFSPREPANLSCMRIILIFSFLLTYAWGILLISKVRSDMGLWLLILTTVVVITVINLVLLQFVKVCFGGKLKKATPIDLETT